MELNSDIADFSEEYYLIEPEVVEFSGEEVVVCEEYYDFLTEFSNPPTVKLGSAHYELDYKWGIPHKTIAVPRGEIYVEEKPVLLVK